MARRTCAIRSIGASAAIGVALVLTSCTTSAYPTPRAPSGDPIQAARALPDAPGAIQGAVAAATCGQFALGQGEDVPAEAVACLDASAAGGSEAELAWSRPTAEGDPIVYFAIAAPRNENVVLFRTNHFDSYGGSFGWTTQACPTQTPPRRRTPRTVATTL